MAQVKLRMLTGMVGVGFSVNRGEIVSLPRPVADRFLAEGKAEIHDAAVVSPVPRKATKPRGW
jgi:hypothetical protein